MSELALQVTTQSLFSEPQELLPFDGSAVLQPRFFDAQRSEHLFESLMQQTAWEQPEMIIFGKKHAQAGLSTWYADNGVDYEYSGVVRVAHPMTPLLEQIRAELETFTGTAFNSVLVNLYRDGKDSVSWVWLYREANKTVLVETNSERQVEGDRRITTSGVGQDLRIGTRLRVQDTVEQVIIATSCVDGA